MKIFLRNHREKDLGEYQATMNVNFVRAICSLNLSTFAVTCASNLNDQIFSILRVFQLCLANDMKFLRYKFSSRNIDLYIVIFYIMCNNLIKRQTFKQLGLEGGRKKFEKRKPKYHITTYSGTFSIFPAPIINAFATPSSNEICVFSQELRFLGNASTKCC